MIHKWILNSAAAKRLKHLTEIIAPSMDEQIMANYLREQWNNLFGNTRIDVMGNLCALSTMEGTTEALQIGVVAHMDTVAIQITNILPNGMLQFRSIGLQPHTLLGQSMKVLTNNGVISGVIGFDPTSQYGQPKGLVLDDLWLDIGARNCDDACQLVEVGNLAVLEPRLEEMENSCLCGTGIDDRIGLFVLNECVMWFAEHSVPVNLYFIGTVQEELGLRGANTAIANLPLDACIIIDVDYATDTPASHENQMGPLHLGKGVGLHAKADNNPVLRRIAKEVANKHQIPYQISLGRFTYGGTDASPLQIQNGGIATLNVNIPCRYMHSPIEMCHKKDVESAIRLIIELVEELGTRQQKKFIPGID